MNGSTKANQNIMPHAQGAYPRSEFPKSKKLRSETPIATQAAVQIGSGKHAGQQGRLVARVKGPYVTQTGQKGRLSCSYKSLQLIQRADGWEYGKQPLGSTA